LTGARLELVFAPQHASVKRAFAAPAIKIAPSYMSPG
jgi:hypothetical protein